MILKSDKKCEELTCCFKNPMGNLANFHPNIRKSENLNFVGLLLSKASNV